MIRIANLKDERSIIEYNIALAKETEDFDLDLETVSKGVKAILNDSNKGHYYVYEEKGGILGQLLVTFEWSDWRNANFWWIQSVYVNKSHRQKGVFQALFEHVKQEAAKQKSVCGLRLYVEKNNQVAKKTYTKLGMYETYYNMFEWMK